MISEASLRNEKQTWQTSQNFPQSYGLLSCKSRSASPASGRSCPGVRGASPVAVWMLPDDDIANLQPVLHVSLIEHMSEESGQIDGSFGVIDGSFYAFIAAAMFCNI
jgi:hypothetical protein